MGACRFCNFSIFSSSFGWQIILLLILQYTIYCIKYVISRIIIYILELLVVILVLHYGTLLLPIYHMKPAGISASQETIRYKCMAAVFYLGIFQERFATVKYVFLAGWVKYILLLELFDLCFAKRLWYMKWSKFLIKLRPFACNFLFSNNFQTLLCIAAAAGEMSIM